MIGAKLAGMRPFLWSRRICLPVQSSSFKYNSKLIPRNPLSLARFPLLLGIAPLYAADRSSNSQRCQPSVALLNPFRSHPEPLQPDWADLKATYRLFDTEEATFEAICEPHWKQTRNTKKGRYLLISDTTDLNYTWHSATEGLGMLGDGQGLASSCMHA